MSPVRLATRRFPHEVVGCLEVLLEDAKQGRVQGLSFAAVYAEPGAGERGCVVDAAGVLYEDPFWGLTFVRALDMFMMRLLESRRRRS